MNRRQLFKFVGGAAAAAAVPLALVAKPAFKQTPEWYTVPQKRYQPFTIDSPAPYAMLREITAHGTGEENRWASVSLQGDEDRELFAFAVNERGGFVRYPLRMYGHQNFRILCTASAIAVSAIIEHSGSLYATRPYKAEHVPSLNGLLMEFTPLKHNYEPGNRLIDASVWT